MQVVDAIFIPTTTFFADFKITLNTNNDKNIFQIPIKYFTTNYDNETNCHEITYNNADFVAKESLETKKNGDINLIYDLILSDKSNLILHNIFPVHINGNSKIGINYNQFYIFYNVYTHSKNTGFIILNASIYINHEHLKPYLRENKNAFEYIDIENAKFSDDQTLMHIDWKWLDVWSFASHKSIFNVEFLKQNINHNLFDSKSPWNWFQNKFLKKFNAFLVVHSNTSIDNNNNIVSNNNVIDMRKNKNFKINNKKIFFVPNIWLFQVILQDSKLFKPYLVLFYFASQYSTMFMPYTINSENKPIYIISDDENDDDNENKNKVSFESTVAALTSYSRSQSQKHAASIKKHSTTKSSSSASSSSKTTIPTRQNRVNILPGRRHLPFKSSINLYNAILQVDKMDVDVRDKGHKPHQHLKLSTRETSSVVKRNKPNSRNILLNDDGEYGDEIDLENTDNEEEEENEEDLGDDDSLAEFIDNTNEEGKIDEFSDDNSSDDLNLSNSSEQIKNTKRRNKHNINSTKRRDVIDSDYYDDGEDGVDDNDDYDEDNGTDADVEYNSEDENEEGEDVQISNDDDDEEEGVEEIADDDSLNEFIVDDDVEEGISDAGSEDDDDDDDDDDEYEKQYRHPKRKTVRRIYEDEDDDDDE